MGELVPAVSRAELEVAQVDAALERIFAATVRCSICCGLGRFADAPCRACGGSGSMPACAQCGLEVVDALFAPCCSGTCRELWERAQPAPIVRKAP